MKINSNFRDYYDYVAGKYGGGDERVPYNRLMIEDPDAEKYKIVESGKSGRIIGYSNVKKTPLGVGYKVETKTRIVPVMERGVRDCVQYAVLFVAGRQYFLQYTEDEKGNVTKEPRIVPDVLIERNFWGKKHYISGTEANSELQDIARYYKAPVFIVTTAPTIRGIHWTEEHLIRNVPVTQQLGLGSYLTAEQAYQEIAMWLGMLYHETMADKPGAPQTDVQKAESHGFDKRLSFRHRK